MFEINPPQDDGLCIQEVGEWSSHKHYFLSRYINAFTTAMKDKAWSGLHYIDIFAGCGIELLKDSNSLDWGSPLIAAQVRYPFTKLHLCESKKTKFNALKFRINKIRSDSQILHGDANKKIYEIINDIPEKSLSLAFLDPYGLHLEFKTLEILSQKRADLIIFFPDHLDALRNWVKYYFPKPDSNLDKCLGQGTNWRKVLNETPANSRPEALRKLYMKQLKEKLGYQYFEFERISNNVGRHIYILIFASRSEKAVDIWKRISNKKPDGQRTFDFE